MTMRAMLPLSVASSCSLEFTGTKQNGNNLTQTFQYNPAGLLSSQMCQVSLNGFDKLVSFNVQTTGLLSGTIATLLLEKLCLHEGGVTGSPSSPWRWQCLLTRAKVYPTSELGQGDD